MSDAAVIPVLLVGNFIGASTRQVCEELAVRLPTVGCPVVTTSAKQPKVARLLDMVTTAWRLRRRYDVAHVDVFSGPAFFWAEAVCAALRMAGKPYVLTLHGGDLPAFARRRPARVRRLLQSAAAVTAPSRYLIDNLADYRADVRCIPNGLDLRAYEPRPRTAATPTLVWLRAFHDRYNPSLAIRVLSIVAARFPDVRLTMIGADKGDGSLQRAQALAAELGVGERVEFRGNVDKRDVPRVLGAADIFLNTTNVDNTPVTLIEAMACGLCVVTTNVGGIPYLVDDDRNAILVAPDDAAAMAAAVMRLLDDPQLAARLAREGRHKAEQFDWSPILGAWRGLLAATARQAA